MRDAVHNVLAVGDMVTWAVAQMQRGTLRTGIIAEINEDAMSRESIYPGTVTITKFRHHPNDRKTVVRHYSQVIKVHR